MEFDDYRFDNPSDGTHVAKIISLYLDGMSIPEIAKELSLTYNYVTKIVPPTDDDSIEGIIEMFEDDFSLDEISLRFQIPRITIYQSLRENKIRVSPRLMTTEIVNLYNQGNTIQEISNLLGIRKMTVHTIVKENFETRRSTVPSRVELPLDDLAKDYEKGFTIKQLADKYGASQGVIFNRLKELRVQTRAAHRGNRKKV